MSINSVFMRFWRSIPPLIYYRSWRQVSSFHEKRDQIVYAFIRRVWTDWVVFYLIFHPNVFKLSWFFLFNSLTQRAHDSVISLLHQNVTTSFWSRRYWHSVWPGGLLQATVDIETGNGLHNTCTQQGHEDQSDMSITGTLSAQYCGAA